MLRNIVRRIIPLLRRHVFLILAAFVLLAVFAILWFPLAYTPLGTIRVWTYVALRMRPFSTAVKDVGSSSLPTKKESRYTGQGTQISPGPQRPAKKWVPVTRTSMRFRAPCEWHAGQQLGIVGSTLPFSSCGVQSYSAWRLW